jgi:hypothetical protein
VAFNPALHPRGPNGRFTRSFARPMSTMDGAKAGKAKSGFKARAFKGAEDARKYLAGLFGGKSNKSSGKSGPAAAGPPSGIKAHIDSGALGRANETLRAGKSGPEVQAIDKEMKPLPDGLDLYRSVPAKKFGNVDPKSLDGMLVSDAGYFPTTVAPTKVAPGNVQMHIQAPAGTPAAVDPDSGQVVLGHGAQLAVDSVDVTPDGSARMDLVVLPDTGDNAPDAPTATPSAPPDAPEPPASAPPSPAAEPSAVTPPASFDQRLADARSGDDALASAPANMLSPDSGLTPEQFDAVDEYRDIFYTGVNNALRGGPNNDEIQSRIDNLDAAMEGSRLTSDIVTYRGLTNGSAMFGDRLGGDLTGMEWDEQAYSSTSADRDLAEEFATNTHDLSRSVVMRMLVPAGVGGITLSDANADGGYPPESEVLLQRGLRLRVVADNGGTPRQIDVEVVPIGQP